MGSALLVPLYSQASGGIACEPCVRGMHPELWLRGRVVYSVVSALDAVVIAIHARERIGHLQHDDARSDFEPQLRTAQ